MERNNTNPGMYEPAFSVFSFMKLTALFFNEPEDAGEVAFDILLKHDFYLPKKAPLDRAIMFRTWFAGKDVGGAPKKMTTTRSSRNRNCPPTMRIKFDFEKSNGLSDICISSIE